MIEVIVGIGTGACVAPIDRTPEFEAENREWVAYAVEDSVFQRGRPADLYTFIPDLNTANRFETLAAMLAQRGHSDTHRQNSRRQLRTRDDGGLGVGR